ncbi:ABC transporter A family member 1 [Nymphaea thermarum]|nr:ABC transporter A family member 1 [Nymphaea thermarum]
MFAILKGVTEDRLENEVNLMIEEVCLVDKQNTAVRALSGGMRRKLSLGIALIGGSKVGSEISFRLPLSSSSSFEGMFMEIESNTKRQGALLEKSGCSEESCIGIESYGISVTTLEEVFLRVAGCDLDEIKPVILDKADHSDEWIPPHASSSCLTSGGGGGPIPFNLSTQISNQVASFMEGGWSQKAELRSYRFPNTGRALFDAIEVAGPVLGPSLLSMSEYLITSLNESYQSRYGAVLMDDQNGDGSIAYTVLHNCSCQHGAPTYINLVNSAILKLAMNDKNMVIHTRNHPLPMTATQHSQHHDLDAFSAAIIINIAFSFIPSSFAVAIVKNIVLLVHFFSGLILMVISFIMGLIKANKRVNIFLKAILLLANHVRTQMSSPTCMFVVWPLY